MDIFWQFSTVCEVIRRDVNLCSIREIFAFVQTRFAGEQKVISV